MKINHSDPVEIINNLIETCNNCKNTFSAAEKAGESDLKYLFSFYSLQCSKFAEELINELIRSGEVAPKKAEQLNENSDSGLSLRGSHRQSILGECEKWQYIAVREYDYALSMGLPCTAREIIKRQNKEVQETYNWIRDLRNAAALTERGLKNVPAQRLQPAYLSK
ncbi:MAG: hypothetical protein WD490_01325 [Opitutales bacterium]